MSKNVFQKKRSGLRATAFFVFVIVFFLSCSQNTVGTTVSNDPNVEAIKALLEGLMDPNINSSRDELNKVFYGLDYIEGLNSKEQLVQGVLDRKLRGSFSFDPDYVETLLDLYSNYIIPMPNPLLYKFFFSDLAVFKGLPTYESIIQNPEENIYVFTFWNTLLVFVKIDGRFRIIYNVNLHLLNHGKENNFGR